MEIRVLRYFMEIAREGSMTKAAERLYVSQPTLSKQMKELEEELGKKLFKRSSASVSLTDEGMLLRKRAEDILAMVDKTKEEFSTMDDITGGEVYIGCAESRLIAFLADKIKIFKESYPNFRYHLVSGNTEQVAERLDRGLIDLAVICEPPDLSKYNYIEVPDSDVWGLVVRQDHPLAAKKQITVEDLSDIELICSEQAIKADIPRWCGEKIDTLKFGGYTNLFYNGSVFVRRGLGGMLTFEGLAATGSESGLCFIPLYPRLETKLFIIWKKYQVFTPIAERLLAELRTRQKLA
ncbi:MAG: LysR family transcriptional regulator [Clostridia bacterium]|nr:LysR family transcriptional regulator [Clostridia bacterium]